MKKLLFYLFLLVIILFYASCKKDTFKNSISVSEFYSYTNTSNTPCDGKLKHEGETVKIYGYISKINTYPEDNRFALYETSIKVGPRLEIHVVKNSGKVFDEIGKHIPNMSNPDEEEIYVKLSIRGKIKGQPLPTNGPCMMGAFIEVNNDNDIRFE